MLSRMSVYWCLVVTCWERAEHWLPFVMSNCDVFTFPLVSWVRCGAWLYRFLIFALFLTLRGYIYQTLLLAWNYSCINKNCCCFFKKTDTFSHIVVWAIYTYHIYHFTPQQTAFEQSAACVSVFLELLPGLIPLAILWHAGFNFRENHLHEYELQISDCNI